MKSTWEIARANKHVLNLRVGEVVEVRSRAEILATLDANGLREGLPFMPEMLQFCGRRFRVYKRADKACDTIGKTGARRMKDTVHLEDARCDGVAHGGCQAACLMFWKKAWLKPVENPSDSASSVNEAESFAAINATQSQGETNSCTEDTLLKATRRESDATSGNEEMFSCQATELPKATSFLAWWDIRQYLRDLRSGNITLLQLIRGASIAAYNMTIRNVHRGALAIRTLMRRLRNIHSVAHNTSYSMAIIPSQGTSSNGQAIYGKLRAIYEKLFVEYPHVQGKLRKTPSEILNLQPGELVHVKSKQEILATLDANNRNRGLYFDVEMVPYCGGTYRVLRRVEKIVDEKTGRMIKLPNGCIILDGVVCSGCLSRNRLFCPRSIYPYWHEIWLKRVERPDAIE